MKKIRWCPVSVVLLTLAILLIALGVSCDRDGETRAGRARQALYQQAVKEFSDALKPGTARSEVESYLRSRDRKFSHVFGPGLSNSASDGAADLVKIGAEKAPPYCSGLDIFVALRFSSMQAGPMLHVSESDKLKDVVLYSMPVDCL